MSLHRTFRVQCDTCFVTSAGAATSKEARQIARRAGYKRRPTRHTERGSYDVRDFCPTCAAREDRGSLG